MPSHEVKAGEHIVRIAKDAGYRSYRTLWDASENGKLHDKRKNPNILLPGDLVELAKAKSKKVNAATEKVHRFQVKSLLDLDFRIVMIDENDKPLAGFACDFLEKGKKVTSDGDGQLEKLDLEPHFELGVINFELKKVDLSERGTEPAALWQGIEKVSPVFAVAIGHLDPIDTPSGLQARLNNLGYWAGELGFADEDAIALECAIEEFELEHGLKPKGDPDNAAMQGKLEEVHGC